MIPAYGGLPSFWRIALVCLLGVLAGCQEALYSQLSETEANEMRITLARAGVAATKVGVENGKFAIEVDRQDAAPALAELQRVGLPREKFASTLDVLKPDSLVPNLSDDRARRAYALSQELSRTIADIDGVVSARVHLVLVDRPGFAEKAAHASTASVLVKHKPGVNLKAASFSIRQLVAKSVEGLTAENVTVLFSIAEPVSTSHPRIAGEAVVSGRDWLDGGVLVWCLLSLVAGISIGFYARPHATLIANRTLRDGAALLSGGTEGQLRINNVAKNVLRAFTR